MTSGEPIEAAAPDVAPGMDANAMIEALRRRGDHRRDRVRFHLIEAMARRAADHAGEVRRILDAKLHELLAAYGRELEKGSPTATIPTRPLGDQVGRGPLGQLVDQVAELSASRPQEMSPSEPEALAYFRNTWSRLSTRRRLKESFSSVPKSPGPFNSHHLVHQALKSMHDASPDYLDRFMSYVDALSWLDERQGAGAAKDVLRITAPRKVARGK